MGTLIYAGAAIEFDDRLLAHMQIVIVQQFRKNRGLPMSWIDAQAAGSGRSCIWLHPAVPLAFTFAGSRSPTIDRDWLERLRISAESSTGLVLTTEDGSIARSTGLSRGVVH